MKNGIVAGLVLMACSPLVVVDGPQTRPAESDSVSGPVVATISIEDTNFELHDEGEGCLALDVGYPGLQRTVERHCFAGDQVIAESDSCGWLANDVDESCPVELPQVLYGTVTDPAIGYVCVGQSEGPGAEGVIGARYLEIGPDGVILEPRLLDDLPYGHLFTSEGVIYGDPPLDAPSAPIYEFCERLAPWGAVGHAYQIDVNVSLAESLRDDRVVIKIDGGTGVAGLSGGAGLGGAPVPLPISVPATSKGLKVWIAVDNEEVGSHTIPWPSQVAAVLNSGEGCPGGLEVELVVTRADEIPLLSENAESGC